jgi:predicted enzyme related to lactoylglutathione lyase
LSRSWALANVELDASTVQREPNDMPKSSSGAPTAQQHASGDVIGVKYLLSVSDMRRATAFYRDVVGLTVLESSDYWTELVHGTAIVALHGGGTSSIKRTGLSFTVKDLAAFCARVEKAGAKVTSGPEDRGEEGIALAQFIDTEGNQIMASQVTR